jgi:hypothetical protein
MVATLAEIQREFPVFDWEIAGVRIWPLARIRWIVGVWTAAFTADAEVAPAVNARRLGAMLRGRRDCTTARRADAAANDPLDGPRDLVFLSDGVSFATLGGKRVERFCDPLIAHARRLGWTAQLWTPTHLYLTPRATPSDFIQPAVDLANAAALVESRVRAHPVHLPGWDALAQWLRARELETPALDRARLLRDAIRIRRLTDLYLARLAKVRPRAAFVVGYYTLESMAFVRACRRHGIPVTDVQHGVQGEGHGAYAGWGRIPERADELLPSYFWVWSAWEAEAIRADLDASRVCIPVVGGNPWMEFWTSAVRDGVRDAAASQAQALAERAGGRPIVLVTLQFGLADALQLEPLRALIEECADGYAWWVRLHPVMAERREEVRSKLGAGDERHVWLDLPSDLALPELLRHAHVHLTHSSSTVIEAACMGVPSILTSESGRDLFEPYLRQGIARVELGAAPELRTALERSVRAHRAPEHERPFTRGDGGLERAFARVAAAPGVQGLVAA